MAHWAEAEDLLLHHLRKRIRLKEHENIVWEGLEWTKEEVDPDQFPEQVWERLPETFVVATTVVFSHQEFLEFLCLTPTRLRKGHIVMKKAV